MVTPFEISFDLSHFYTGPGFGRPLPAGDLPAL
jgi:hypothetical protein